MPKHHCKSIYGFENVLIKFDNRDLFSITHATHTLKHSQQLDPLFLSNNILMRLVVRNVLHFHLISSLASLSVHLQSK
jgi:hypothetical protein